ncbi:hypothetical protein SAMN05421765_0721 [Kaistella antarctica]|uniref:Uncharacterized protein n=1 Tax=Kaistella antarctica TaxID=266748 RepID=A0A3S4UZV1_9FLAO|nr:hypothetical protein SAMN05421765_0721 [Kaistella antarctica]VEI01056.1 Uncharacterised protein [Kaistella antarctica]
MIKKSVRISVICAQKNFIEFALTCLEFEECLFLKLNCKLETNRAPD